MIKADLDVCVAAGMCALTAPRVFDQAASDGRVVVLEPNPLDVSDVEAANLAVQLCPSGAISFEEPQPSG